MRIVLSCDLLRSGGAAGDPEISARWLWSILYPCLDECGHEITFDTRHHRPTAYAIAVARSGLAPRADWPTLYSDPGALELVRATCRVALAADLVISHELSPNQLRVLNQAGIKVLDIRLDPVRFGADLLLRARTNDPVLASWLRNHDLSDDALAPSVAAMRVRCCPTNDAYGPALLFAGQTDADASLIENARLQSVLPFIDRIRALREPGWQLLLKPHPYAQANSDIRALQEAVPDAIVVRDDIYALLCAPTVSRVVTMSSSVATEARLFGKLTTELIAPDRETTWMVPQVRLTVDALCRTAQKAFQRTGRPTPARRPTVDVRAAVGQTWGYVPSPRLRANAIFGGQILSFATGGQADEVLTLGWAAPEDDGCWTVGATATMLLRPQTPGLTLSLDVIPFVSRRRGPLCLTLETGAGPALQRIFWSGRRTCIDIPLPKSPGAVQLRFKLSGLTSPAKCGHSADTRELGLKLLSATAARPKAGAKPVRHVVGRYGRTLANLSVLLLNMIG